MSGIMEEILSELKSIRTDMATLSGHAFQLPKNGGDYVAPGSTITQPTQPVAQQPVHDPFAAIPAPTPAANGAITEAHVMSLIEPHLDNAPLKAALSGVLAQMGIARLPEARPDQYPALYQAFQGVIAQHAAPAAAAAVSII